jgi:mannitol/fructose-specific phosphotransferase system IIA component (Ntr-type)
VKLTEFISRKAILVNLRPKDKRGAISELVQVMRKTYEGERFAASEIVDAIMEREKLGSTGVGGGVAVPHAKLGGIKGVIGAFGRCSRGLDFDAVDGESVHLIFLILSPPSRSDAYLQALQKVMTTIRRPNVLKFLRNARTAKDVDEIFRDVEEVAPV